ncbi:uncharacterized protein LOC134399610 [Elgaria multicarinata webbii]|uniref:uncharacterized protein LOC134399610 n=1 Tax=Elgaria multicarinata webbii TaxID=159646 RepID=UPI002FCD2865
MTMEYKTFWLLAVALCLCSVCSQNGGHPPYACQCLMDVKERERCHSTSIDITAEECTANGCCFDATVPDAPWCFRPSGERASLRYAKKMIEPQARIDCGYPGITSKRCKRIGCCFDPKTSSTPGCFHPQVNNVSQHCVMDWSARQDCGYPGITAEECQAKGCCFNSYVVSSRWCFHPLSDAGTARLCGMAPKKRVQCGHPGISADECLEKGCCYERYQYAKQVPWCFEPSAKQGNEVRFCQYDCTSYCTKDNCSVKLFMLVLQVKESCSMFLHLGLPACPLPRLTSTNQMSPSAWECLRNEDGGRLDGGRTMFASLHPEKSGFRGLYGTMEKMGICVLSLILILGISTLLEGMSLPPDCQCDAEPKNRTNCGPPGISPQECVKNGCCFDSQVPGVPWCFTGVRHVCPKKVSDRVNCGYPAIPKDTCEKRGCCFRASPPGVPWCFFKVKVETGQQRNCNVPPRRRRECGWAGISRQQCVSRGCCFNNSIRGVKWCFNPQVKQFLFFGNVQVATPIPDGVGPAPNKQKIVDVKIYIRPALVVLQQRTYQLGLSSLANGFRLQIYPGQCEVIPVSRINCGYPYISAEECYNRGCCFDSSIADTIWCFFPGDEYGSATLQFMYIH